MRNFTRTGMICIVLAVSACATANPQAPDLRNAIVEPLNPTKWDYQEAVERRQEALAGLPAEVQ